MKSNKSNSNFKLDFEVDMKSGRNTVPNREKSPNISNNRVTRSNNTTPITPRDLQVMTAKSTNIEKSRARTDSEEEMTKIEEMHDQDQNRRITRSRSNSAGKKTPEVPKPDQIDTRTRSTKKFEVATPTKPLFTTSLRSPRITKSPSLPSRNMSKSPETTRKSTRENVNNEKIEKDSPQKQNKNKNEAKNIETANNNVNNVKEISAGEGAQKCSEEVAGVRIRVETAKMLERREEEARRELKKQQMKEAREMRQSAEKTDKLQELQDNEITESTNENIEEEGATGAEKVAEKIKKVEVYERIITQSQMLTMDTTRYENNSDGEDSRNYGESSEENENEYVGEDGAKDDIAWTEFGAENFDADLKHADEGKEESISRGGGSTDCSVKMVPVVSADIEGHVDWDQVEPLITGRFESVEGNPSDAEKENDGEERMSLPGDSHQKSGAEDVMTGIKTRTEDNGNQVTSGDALRGDEVGPQDVGEEGAHEGLDLHEDMNNTNENDDEMSCETTTGYETAEEQDITTEKTQKNEKNTTKTQKQNDITQDITNNEQVQMTVETQSSKILNTINTSEDAEQKNNTTFDQDTEKIIDSAEDTIYDNKNETDMNAMTNETEKGNNKVNESMANDQNAENLTQDMNREHSDSDDSAIMKIDNQDGQEQVLNKHEQDNLNNNNNENKEEKAETRSNDNYVEHQGADGTGENKAVGQSGVLGGTMNGARQSKIITIGIADLSISGGSTSLGPEDTEDTQIMNISEDSSNTRVDEILEGYHNKHGGDGYQLKRMDAFRENSGYISGVEGNSRGTLDISSPSDISVSGSDRENNNKTTVEPMNISPETISANLAEYSAENMNNLICSTLGRDQGEEIPDNVGQLLAEMMMTEEQRISPTEAFKVEQEWAQDMHMADIIDLTLLTDDVSVASDSWQESDGNYNSSSSNYIIMKQQQYQDTQAQSTPEVSDDDADALDENMHRAHRTAVEYLVQVGKREKGGWTAAEVRASFAREQQLATELWTRTGGEHTWMGQNNKKDKKRMTVIKNAKNKIKYSRDRQKIYPDFVAAWAMIIQEKEQRQKSDKRAREAQKKKERRAEMNKQKINDKKTPIIMNETRKTVTPLRIDEVGNRGPKKIQPDPDEKGETGDTYDVERQQSEKYANFDQLQDTIHKVSKIKTNKMEFQNKQSKTKVVKEESVMSDSESSRGSSSLEPDFVDTVLKNISMMEFKSQADNMDIQQIPQDNDLIVMSGRIGKRSVIREDDDEDDEDKDKDLNPNNNNKKSAATAVKTAAKPTPTKQQKDEEKQRKLYLTEEADPEEWAQLTSRERTAARKQQARLLEERDNKSDEEAEFGSEEENPSEEDEKMQQTAHLERKGKASAQSRQKEEAKREREIKKANSNKRNNSSQSSSRQTPSLEEMEAEETARIAEIVGLETDKRNEIENEQDRDQAIEDLMTMGENHMRRWRIDEFCKRGEGETVKAFNERTLHMAQKERNEESEESKINRDRAIASISRDMERNSNKKGKKNAQIFKNKYGLFTAEAPRGTRPTPGEWTKEYVGDKTLFETQVDEFRSERGRPVWTSNDRRCLLQIIADAAPDGNEDECQDRAVGVLISLNTGMTERVNRLTNPDDRLRVASDEVEYQIQFFNEVLANRNERGAEFDRIVFGKGSTWDVWTSEYITVLPPHRRTPYEWDKMSGGKSARKPWEQIMDEKVVNYNPEQTVMMMQNTGTSNSSSSNINNNDNSNNNNDEGEANRVMNIGGEYISATLTPAFQPEIVDDFDLVDYDEESTPMIADNNNEEQLEQPLEQLNNNSDATPAQQQPESEVMIVDEEPVALAVTLVAETEMDNNTQALTNNAANITETLAEQAPAVEIAVVEHTPVEVAPVLTVITTIQPVVVGAGRGSQSVRNEAARGAAVDLTVDAMDVENVIVETRDPMRPTPTNSNIVEAETPATVELNETNMPLVMGIPDLATNNNYHPVAEARLRIITTEQIATLTLQPTQVVNAVTTADNTPNEAEEPALKPEPETKTPEVREGERIIKALESTLKEERQEVISPYIKSHPLERTPPKYNEKREPSRSSRRDSPRDSRRDDSRSKDSEQRRQDNSRDYNRDRSRDRNRDRSRDRRRDRSRDRDNRDNNREGRRDSSRERHYEKPKEKPTVGAALPSGRAPPVDVKQREKAKNDWEERRGQDNRSKPLFTSRGPALFNKHGNFQAIPVHSLRATEYEHGSSESRDTSRERGERSEGSTFSRSSRKRTAEDQADAERDQIVQEFTPNRDEITRSANRFNRQVQNNIDTHLANMGITDHESDAALDEKERLVQQSMLHRRGDGRYVDVDGKDFDGANIVQVMRADGVIMHIHRQTPKFVLLNVTAELSRVTGVLNSKRDEALRRLKESRRYHNDNGQNNLKKHRDEDPDGDEGGQQDGPGAYGHGGSRNNTKTTGATSSNNQQQSEAQSVPMTVAATKEQKLPKVTEKDIIRRKARLWNNHEPAREGSVSCMSNSYSGSDQELERSDSEGEMEPITDAASILRVADADGGLQRAIRESLHENDWVEVPVARSKLKRASDSGGESLSDQSGGSRNRKLVGGMSGCVSKSNQVRHYPISLNKGVGVDKGKNYTTLYNTDNSGNESRASKDSKGSRRAKVTKGPTPVGSPSGTAGSAKQKKMEDFMSREGFEQNKEKRHTSQHSLLDSIVRAKANRMTQGFKKAADGTWVEIDDEPVAETAVVEGDESDSSLVSEASEMSKKKKTRNADQQTEKKKQNKISVKKAERTKTPTKSPLKSKVSERSIRKKKNNGGDDDSSSSDDDQDKEGENNSEGEKRKEPRDDGLEDIETVKKRTYRAMIKKMRQVMKEKRGLPPKWEPEIRKGYVRIMKEAEEGEFVPSLEVINVQEEMLALILERFEGENCLDQNGCGMRWKYTNNNGMFLKGKRFVYGGRVVSRETVEKMSNERRKKVMSVLRGTKFIDASGTIPSGTYKGGPFTPSLINSYRWNEDEDGDDRPSRNNMKIVAPNRDNVAEIEILRHVEGEEAAMHYSMEYDWTHEKIRIVREIAETIVEILETTGWKTNKRLKTFREALKQVEEMKSEKYNEILKMRFDNIYDRVTREIRSMISLVEGDYEDIENFLDMTSAEDKDIVDVHFPHHLYRINKVKQHFEFNQYNKPTSESDTDEEPERKLKTEDLVYTMRYMWHEKLCISRIVYRPANAVDRDRVTVNMVTATADMGRDEFNVQVTADEEKGMRELEKYVATKGREPIAIMTVKLIEEMYNRISSHHGLKRLPIPTWLIDVGYLMDAMHKIKQKRVRRNQRATERGQGHSSGSESSYRSRRSGGPFVSNVLRRNEDAREIVEEVRPPIPREIVVDEGSTGNRRATRSNNQQDNAVLQDLLSIVRSTREQMANGARKGRRKQGDGDNMSELSDVLTVNEDGDWAKRDDASEGVTSVRGRRKALTWETREIPDGFEHLYTEKADAAKGFIQHRWPHMLIGRTQLELNRIIPRIPNFDYEEMRIQKVTAKICSPESYLKRGYKFFTGDNVFEWVKGILRIMENDNTHPNVMACAIWKGEFMIPERRAEIEDERQNCVLGTTTDGLTRAFQRISNKKEVEKSVLWLEALLMWMMERHGRRELLTDAQEEIAELKLKTRSLVGIWKLHNKIRQLQKQLPTDQRSYAVYDKFFYNALERNPHVDPMSLVHTYNTQKTLMELSLKMAHSPDSFDKLTDEEKFEHTKIVLKAMHEKAIREREDTREYDEIGKPVNSTEAEAQRLYQMRQQKKKEQTSDNYRNEQPRHNNDQRSNNNNSNNSHHNNRQSVNGGTGQQYNNQPSRDRPWAPGDNRRRENNNRVHSINTEDGDTINEIRLFQISFDAKYHEPDNNRRGAAVDLQQMESKLVGQGFAPKEIKEKMMDELDDSQKTKCACCSFTGHRRADCTICVNGEISKDILAQYDKERADRRMYSSRIRGGDLSKMSPNQYKSFMAEVDQIRETLRRRDRGMPETPQMLEEGQRRNQNRNKWAEKRDVREFFPDMPNNNNNDNRRGGGRGYQQRSQYQGGGQQQYQQQQYHNGQQSYSNGQSQNYNDNQQYNQQYDNRGPPPQQYNNGGQQQQQYEHQPRQQYQDQRRNNYGGRGYYNNRSQYDGGRRSNYNNRQYNNQQYQQQSHYQQPLLLDQQQPPAQQPVLLLNNGPPSGGQTNNTETKPAEGLVTNNSIRIGNSSESSEKKNIRPQWEQHLSEQSEKLRRQQAELDEDIMRAGSPGAWVEEQRKMHITKKPTWTEAREAVLMQMENYNRESESEDDDFRASEERVDTTKESVESVESEDENENYGRGDKWDNSSKHREQIHQDWEQMKNSANIEREQRKVSSTKSRWETVVEQVKQKRSSDSSSEYSSGDENTMSNGIEEYHEDRVLRKLKRELEITKQRALRYEQEQIKADELLAIQLQLREKKELEREERERDRRLREKEQDEFAEQQIQEATEKYERAEKLAAVNTRIQAKTLEESKQQVKRLQEKIELLNEDTEEWFETQQELDEHLWRQYDLEKTEGEEREENERWTTIRRIRDIMEIFERDESIEDTVDAEEPEPVVNYDNIGDFKELCKSIAYWGRVMTGESNKNGPNSDQQAFQMALGALNNIDVYAACEMENNSERMRELGTVHWLDWEHDVDLLGTLPLMNQYTWELFLRRMRKEHGKPEPEKTVEKRGYAEEWMRECEEAVESTPGTYQYTVAEIEMIENEMRNIDRDSEEWEAANWRLVELRLKLDDPSETGHFENKQWQCMQRADEICWARERARRKQLRKTIDGESSDNNSAYEDQETKRMMDRVDGILKRGANNAVKSKKVRKLRKGMKGILCNIAREDSKALKRSTEQEKYNKANGIYRERKTHNVGLTYMRFTVTKPVEADEWMGYERSDTSGKHNSSEKGTMLDIQFDGGAGWSVVSQEFAETNGLRFLEKENPIGVVGFDGSVIKVKYYTVIALEIEGKDVKGNWAKRRFVTQALITPGLHVDFILGSNVAMQHNITVIPDQNQAVLFRDEEKLIVPCLSWDKLTSNMKNSKKDPSVSVRMMATADIEEMELEESRQMRTELRRLVMRRGMPTVTEEEKRGLEIQIIRTVIEWAQLFFEVCKKTPERITVAALMIVAKYFDIPQVKDRVERMMALLFDGNDRHIISERMFRTTIENQPDVKFSIKCIRLITETQIYTHPRAQLVNVTRIVADEIEEVFDDMQQRENEELEQSRKAVENYKRKHCTEEMLGLKPDEFPTDLWKLVMDSQKPLVKARFESFDKNIVRKTELIKTILEVDVSKETEARREERDLFVAQALANLDRFEHPDEFDQPRIKGKEFTIDLVDRAPSTTGFQKFTGLETLFLKLKIDEMIAQKRVERSNSSWNSRLSLVPYYDRMKKFADKHGDNATKALEDPENAAEVKTFYRLTTDLRNLNQKTRAMIYPLPSISKIIDSCKGSNRFSTGDVRDAFFTVSMEKKSREYTAFSTPDGHFHFCVMPQGAKNSATYWAEMIADVFRQMTEKKAPIIVYQDDIGNYARELIEHLETQQDTYDTLRPNDMILKTSKVHLNYTTQRILGHMLNGEGRSVDPKTIEAVTKLQKPKNVSDVRTILGLFQYAREYIENLSDIAAPIQELLKKGIDVEKEWQDDVHGVAFEALKIALTTAPILRIPDITKPFRIEVDACRVGRGIGAILLQRDEKEKWRPCAYWSRALTKAERRYSATELECTALHDTILHWKNYVRNGMKFEVIVDHYALVYMVTKLGTEQQNQRLLRLCLDLQGFDFEVIHQAGTRHLGADAVSRLLQIDEMPYVRDEDELRDDWGPLSDRDKELLTQTYSKDAWFLIQTIDEYREKRRTEEQSEREFLEQELENKKKEREAELMKREPMEMIDLKSMINIADTVEFSSDSSMSSLEDERVIMCGECDKPVTVERTSDFNNTREERELEKQMEGQVRQFRMICKGKGCTDWRRKGTYYEDSKKRSEEKKKLAAAKAMEERRKCHYKMKETVQEAERKWRGWPPRDSIEEKDLSNEPRPVRPARVINIFTHAASNRVQETPIERHRTIPADQEKRLDAIIGWKKTGENSSQPAAVNGVKHYEGRTSMRPRPWISRYEDPYKARYSNFEKKSTEEQLYMQIEGRARGHMFEVQEMSQRKAIRDRMMTEIRNKAVELRREREEKQGFPTMLYEIKACREVKGSTLSGKLLNKGSWKEHIMQQNEVYSGEAKELKAVRETIWDLEAQQQILEIQYNENKIRCEERIQQDVWKIIKKQQRCIDNYMDDHDIFEPIGGVRRMTDAEVTQVAKWDLNKNTTVPDIGEEVQNQKVGIGSIEWLVGREMNDKWYGMIVALLVDFKIKGLDQMKTISLETALQSKLLVPRVRVLVRDEINRRTSMQRIIKSMSDKSLIGELVKIKKTSDDPREVEWGRRVKKEVLERAWRKDYAKEKENLKESELSDRRINEQFCEKYASSDQLINTRRAEYILEEVEWMKLLIYMDQEKPLSEKVEWLTTLLKMRDQNKPTAQDEARRRERIMEERNRVPTEEMRQKEVSKRVHLYNNSWKTPGGLDGRRIEDEKRRIAEENEKRKVAEEERQQKVKRNEIRIAEQESRSGSLKTGKIDEHGEKQIKEIFEAKPEILIHASRNQAGHRRLLRLRRKQPKETKKQREERQRKDEQLPSDIQRKVNALEEESKNERDEFDNIQVFIADQTKKIEAYRARAAAQQRKIDEIKEKQEELRIRGLTPGYRNNDAKKEEAEITLKKLTSEYDCLISQFYLCPNTRQLYQIIDVRVQGTTKKNKIFVAISRPISCEEDEDTNKVAQTIPIEGENGAIELTTNYLKGRRHNLDVSLPNTDEEWAVAQREDIILSRLIAKLAVTENNILPLDNKKGEASKDFYFLHGGGKERGEKGVLKRQVYRTHENTHNEVKIRISRGYTQTVVPTRLRGKVMMMMHDAMGHPGRSRTTETTKMKYHWPSIYTDVRNFIAQCRFCQLRKANNRVARVPIMIYNYSERPNSRVHMDLAGPFPETVRKHNYILVIKCALTKWVVIVPVRDKEMDTVQREYLNIWIANYGAPAMLITDRGSEFCNQIADQLASIWGCRKVETTPRNPRADGIAENQMRTMKDMLTSFISENQRDWDEFLPIVSQSYNNTVNDATGFTPYYLMHGTEMTNPSEEHLQGLNINQFSELTRRTRDVMQWCWSYAGKIVLDNSDRHNKRLEGKNGVPPERLPFKPYEEGDFFYMRVVPKVSYKDKDEEEAMQISSKLQYRYTGPYMIKTVLSPVLYKAVIHGEEKAVHALNMKPAAKDKNMVKTLKEGKSEIIAGMSMQMIL